MTLPVILSSQKYLAFLTLILIIFYLYYLIIYEAPDQVRLYQRGMIIIPGIKKALKGENKEMKILYLNIYKYTITREKMQIELKKKQMINGKMEKIIILNIGILNSGFHKEIVKHFNRISNKYQIKKKVYYPNY